MPFSDKIKFKVKKSSHQCCCICKNIGIEIHHIIPQSENGPDTFENAAPLCPSCHETYGANPTKRKFIKESRDIWYEICKKKYDFPISKLEALISKVDGIHSMVKGISKERNENEKPLKIGELFDYLNTFKLKENEIDQSRFNIALVFLFTITELESWKAYFEALETFKEIFGTYWLKKIAIYGISKLDIKHNEKGLSEEELLELHSTTETMINLIIMNHDLDIVVEKIDIIKRDDELVCFVNPEFEKSINWEEYNKK